MLSKSFLAECYVIQLLYKLREKGLINTAEMREIIENAESEWLNAKQLVEKEVDN